MEIRLDPMRGGDGTSVHRISVVHDTGSNIMSIFDTDLAKLGDMQNFHGWIGRTNIRNASGQTEIFGRFLLQIRLIDYNHKHWTDWMTETALVRPSTAGTPRLSGSLIRNQFIFAMPKGNRYVAVGTEKAVIDPLI